MEQNEPQVKTPQSYINEITTASAAFRKQVEGEWCGKKPNDIDSLNSLLEYTKETRNMMLDISTILNTWNFNGHLPKKLEGKKEMLCILTQAAWGLMEEVEGTLYTSYYDEQEDTMPQEEQVDTEIDLDTATLAGLAIYAHEKNITINEAINEILENAIKEKEQQQ
jgi:hypothetical protein